MSEAIGRPQDHADAARRLPSIFLIDEFAIQEEVARLTCQAPDYFWRVPASTSGYHHPICREPRGLWAHTLMLSTVIERLRDSLVECEVLSPRQIDYAHAAAVLHDQRKNGDPADPAEKSVGDHDLRMGGVIRRESALPEAVARAVESHMGAWYDGPAPEAELEWLVHVADMVASTHTITPAVPAPLPDELRGMGLTEVDL